VNRHVATERPLTLSPDQVRRFLGLHGRAPATRLRLPVRCGTSIVDGSRAGPRRWSALDIVQAGTGPGPCLKARDPDLDTEHRIDCRFHDGLRLWVRERFHADHPPTYYAERFRERDGLAYEADYASGGGFHDLMWEPAPKMVRAMSRLDLDVTGLTVQRLLEAGDEDAGAEGFPSGEALVEAFRSDHGGRLAVGAEASPWTWVLHVTARPT